MQVFTASSIFRRLHVITSNIHGCGVLTAGLIFLIIPAFSRCLETSSWLMRVTSINTTTLRPFSARWCSSSGGGGGYKIIDCRFCSPVWTSAVWWFVSELPGVPQESPGRRLCCRVCQVRSVNQTPPSLPSPYLQTTREAAALTLLTATLSHSSSWAHFWSGINQKWWLLLYVCQPGTRLNSHVSYSDAKPVCGCDHGQLWVFDSRLLHSGSSSPGRVCSHLGGVWPSGMVSSYHCCDYTSI